MQGGGISVFICACVYITTVPICALLCIRQCSRLFVPSCCPTRSTEVSDCGNYVILYVNRGAEPKNLLYYCDLRELQNGGDIRGTVQYEFVRAGKVVHILLCNIVLETSLHLQLTCKPSSLLSIMFVRRSGY